MRYANPDELTTSVKEAVGLLRLAGKLKSVDIEAGDFDGGTDFLKVIVHFESLDLLSEDALDEITMSIERDLSKKDDRFPSVRFAEP